MQLGAALPSWSLRSLAATALPSSVVSSRTHRSGRKAGRHTGTYSVSTGKEGWKRVPGAMCTVSPAGTSTSATPSCDSTTLPLRTQITRRLRFIKRTHEDDSE